MTHFYYDGRRKYYSTEEVAVINGHNFFKEEMARIFKDFIDLSGAADFDGTPEEWIEGYNVVREEIDEGEIEDEYGMLTGVYGRFRYDQLIRSLEEYITLHKAMVVLLEQWKQETQLNKKENIDKAQPALGVSSVTDPELLQERFRD
jgi:hypothetical protein